MNSAKAGRVCRSCGVCQLLPDGTLGRGEISLLISALSLALKAAAPAGSTSSTQRGVGKSSRTCCFTFMLCSIAEHVQDSAIRLFGRDADLPGTGQESCGFLCYPRTLEEARVLLAPQAHGIGEGEVAEVVG